jgi:hypothetical protein
MFGEGRSHLPGLLAPLLLLLAPALYQGIRTTESLSWPPDVDLYRDIAQAQTMADGHLLADPFYRGETIWYNPLVPFLVAQASRLTGLPVHTAYTRAGAYLNLLAPIAFFLLVGALFGRLAAAVATLDFLFLRDPGDPAWLSPSYSPWLYSPGFVQGLFFLGILAYRAARASGAGRGYVLAGALLGLTFLGHTAPALVLGAVILWCWVLPAKEGGEKRLGAMGRGHALLLGTALIVATPFLWSILFHYHLHVLNPTPLAWLWPPLAEQGAAGVLDLGSWPEAAAALVGVVWLVARGDRPGESRLIVAWAVVASALFLYTLAGSSLLRAGFAVPMVPPHHFLFSLKALESVLVGYGLSTLLVAAGRHLDVTALRGGKGEVALLLSLALGVGIAYPGYLGREAYVMARRQAEKDDAKITREEARDWIRAHTGPDDVFLAADDIALIVVGAAGRKSVALDPYFSNPYVDWKHRRDARNAMVAALESGGEGPFAALARDFGVTLVIRKSLSMVAGLRARPLPAS